MFYNFARADRTLRIPQRWKLGLPTMSGQSKKSPGSSKSTRGVPEVDDADVQRFVDTLIRDESFARAPSWELAEKLALGSQEHSKMTKGYAEEFARKVREKVKWIKPLEKRE